MAVEAEHDLPDLLRLLPRMDDPLPALRSDPVHRLEFGGSDLMPASRQLGQKKVK
jgi:hypothetical protein